MLPAKSEKGLISSQPSSLGTAASVISSAKKIERPRIAIWKSGLI